MQNFLFILFICFLAHFQLEAKNFHALLTGDTFSDVKEAATCDIKHIRKELHDICNTLDMTLHVKELKGKALTKTHVRKWLASDAISADDIIFFYFTGHGF